MLIVFPTLSLTDFCYQHHVVHVLPCAQAFGGATREGPGGPPLKADWKHDRGLGIGPTGFPRVQQWIAVHPEGSLWRSAQQMPPDMSPNCLSPLYLPLRKLKCLQTASFCWRQTQLLRLECVQFTAAGKDTTAAFPNSLQYICAQHQALKSGA